MKKLRNWIVRKILVRIFSEVSTTSCASKEAGTITIFDACRHYGASLALIVCVFALSGCATNTGDPKKDARGRAWNEAGKQAFNAVLNFGLSEGSQYLAGRNGQDAAAGAFEAAKSATSSFNIGAIVSAYAGPEIGAVAEEQMIVAKPANGAQAKQLANIIGAALQLRANQLAKS